MADITLVDQPKPENIAAERHYDENGISSYFPESIPHPLFSKLTVPKLRKGTVQDIKTSKTVYGHISPQEVLIPTLEEHIRLDQDGAPIYVVGSHNYGLFAIAEAKKEGLIEDGAVVINFDNHPDDRYPDSELNSMDLNDLKTVAEKTPQVGIGSFLAPLYHQGVINNMVWVKSFLTEQDLEKDDQNRRIPHETLTSTSQRLKEIIASVKDPKKLIVSIDMDVLSPMLFDPRYSSFPPHYALQNRDAANAVTAINEDLAIMREAIKKAGVVLVASSPGYIDQDQAVQLIYMLLQ